MNDSKYYIDEFSATSFCEESARIKLENKYRNLLEVSKNFNRRNVSYQANKDLGIYNWFKFKEAFSDELVKILLSSFNLSNDSIILDPFAGSGTTLFSAATEGINSIGFDIMPFSKIIIDAKTNLENYDLNELKSLIDDFHNLEIPKNFNKRTHYVPITKDAYPDSNDHFLAFISDWIENKTITRELKNLFLVSVLNSLENSSYTTKKGQYLGWDSRSKKVIDRNNYRIKNGLKPSKPLTVRKDIENIRDLILEDLNQKFEDIKKFRKVNNLTGNINFQLKNSLSGLPELESNSVDSVITSPPYCNRYDYTRTYALELAFLGLSDQELKELRQEQLSSTIENKSKLEILKQIYSSKDRIDDYKFILKTVQQNLTYKEILKALNERKIHGDLNNNGIIRMVDGYFTELSFIIFELFRICKPGAYVVMVNDNVRYGGEIIPVDFLLTELAESFGFEPVKIYCIEQLKGNSSQQMKRFGKVNLRKSITIWRKPLL